MLSSLKITVNNILSLLGWTRGVNKAFVNQKSISFEGHTHDASQIVSGILPQHLGGTGYNSLDQLKNALGITNNNYKIDYGITAGSNSNCNVYFNITFTKAPIVVGTLSTSNGIATGYGVVNIENISTTYCFFNVYGLSRFNIYWIALGV